MTTTLFPLGEERFVSMTTFRRTGEPVSTPVWIGREGDDLVVLTPTDSGKVKRLRHTTRVELRPCDRRGRVADGAPTSTAVAEIRDEPGAVDRVRAVMRAKYGAEYRIFMVIEALVRRSRHTDRVAVHLRPS